MRKHIAVGVVVLFATGASAPLSARWDPGGECHF